MSIKCGRCYESVIELHHELIKGVPYIGFRFCCRAQLELLRCKAEDVFKNFDTYYIKCLDIIKKLKICYNCNRYDGFEINNQQIQVSNGLNIVCSQGCIFCLAARNVDLCNELPIKAFQDISNKMLETIKRTKVLKNFCVSCQGEPFEVPYIKNDFLFNIHNSSLNYITILTNLVHVDKDYLIKLHDYLTSHKIDHYIIVNCAGFTKEVYESYCTGKFDVVKENIKNLYEIFGEENCRIQYIVSHHNKDLKRDEVCEQFIKNFPTISIKNVTFLIDLHWILKSDPICDELSKEYFLSDKDYFYNHMNKKQ